MSVNLHSVLAVLTISAAVVAALIQPISASSLRSETSSLCLDAAQHAATKTGVPLDVLRSISLSETGRTKDGAFDPWPWTVNMEGVGKWFDSYEQAQAYVDRHFQDGARSFDVGCFQINYRWHGDAFASVRQMFDPRMNALYAARFLQELHGEFGNWSQAAGAYHSRTPKLARKYAARFDRIRAKLQPFRPTPDSAPIIVGTGPTAKETPTQVQRINRFPLLVAGTATGSLGSLVPEHPASGTARFLNLAARPAMAAGG